jgi:hypothetical protein
MSWTDQKKNRLEEILKGTLSEGGVDSVSALKPGDVWQANEAIFSDGNYKKRNFATNFNRARSKLITDSGAGEEGTTTSGMPGLTAGIGGKSYSYYCMLKPSTTNRVAPRVAPIVNHVLNWMSHRLMNFSRIVRYGCWHACSLRQGTYQERRTFCHFPVDLGHHL